VGALGGLIADIFTDDRATIASWAGLGAGVGEMALSGIGINKQIAPTGPEPSMPPTHATATAPAGPPKMPLRLIVTHAPRPPVYRHTLTQGGLKDIAENQRLRAGTARVTAGGGDAVRAFPGRYRFEELGAPSRPVIEFTTKEPGRPRGFGLAGEGRSWDMPAGDYLEIQIRKIYHPSGAISVYPD
jgi:hypothetical protein